MIDAIKFLLFVDVDKDLVGGPLYRSASSICTVAERDIATYCSGRDFHLLMMNAPAQPGTNP
jgi:hypothetical protein